MRAFSVLQQAIASPVFSDEQKTRLAILLHRITLGLAVIALGFIAISVILSSKRINLLFGFVVLSLCLLMNLATRKGYVHTASLGLVTSLWLIFSIATITGQGAGVFSASFTGYIIPIIVAGYLISGRAGMAFAFLSVAAGGIIIAVQMSSGTNDFPLPRLLLQWIGQSVIFISGAYLLALTRGSMIEALIRAQKDERDLSERNAELQQEMLKRQHVEDTLRGQYNRLRGAFSAAGLDTWIWDSTNDIITYPDTDAETVAPYPHSMQAFMKLVHPDDMETTQKLINEALAETGHYEAVYRYLNPNGKLEWYFTQGDTYFDAEGHVAGLTGASLDITRRKVAEEDLHASESAARAFQEKLKALHEVSVDLARTDTLDELYRKAILLGRDKLGFSRLGLFLLGDNPSLVVGTYGIDPKGQIRDEHELNFALGNNQMVMEALQSRSHVSVRYDIELWDNTSVIGRGWNAMALLWNRTSAIGWLASDNLLDGEPLRDDQLELLSLYGSFLGPLILKKQAEMEVQGHQQRLRLALKAAQMRTWNWNLRTNEIIADEPERFDLRRATRVEDFYRQVHPADHAAIQSAVERAIQENVPYVVEYRITDLNNSIRWVSALGQVYHDESGTAVAIVGVSQDITERKQAEERFFKAFHANPSAIAITTVDEGRYIEVNRAWGELLGFSREESIGHTSVEVGFIDNLADRRAIVEKFNEQGYIRDLELLVGGKDGKKVLILMQAEQIELDGKTCFLTMLQDVSGRKESEKQALELALEKERVALLTEFMGNVSHDIKTPLTAINTSLYLLERTNDADKQREKLVAIRTQTRLLEKFIQDILTISRLDYSSNLELKPVRLNRLLDDIEMRMRPSTERKNITLKLELEAAATPVLGDDDELDRVLVNLVENAVNYTTAGGTVTVRTFVVANQLVIEVADTGIGIKPEEIPNIFNRFYRAESARSTHDAGTGLGLAIVQKIVSMHNGIVEVDSIVGQGSTFRVRLPLALGAG
jgi:PAS domain S-box-containing protein